MGVTVLNKVTVFPGHSPVVLDVVFTA